MDVYNEYNIVWLWTLCIHLYIWPFSLFWLLLLGVTTAEHLSPFYPVSCILLCHTNCRHILPNNIYKFPLWLSSSSLTWHLQPQYSLRHVPPYPSSAHVQTTSVLPLLVFLRASQHVLYVPLMYIRKVLHLTNTENKVVSQKLIFSPVKAQSTGLNKTDSRNVIFWCYWVLLSTGSTEQAWISACHAMHAVPLYASFTCQADCNYGSWLNLRKVLWKTHLLRLGALSQCLTVTLMHVSPLEQGRGFGDWLGGVGMTAGSQEVRCHSLYTKGLQLPGQTTQDAIDKDLSEFQAKYHKRIYSLPPPLTKFNLTPLWTYIHTELKKQIHLDSLSDAFHLDSHSDTFTLGALWCHHRQKAKQNSISHPQH